MLRLGSNIFRLHCCADDVPVLCGPRATLFWRSQRDATSFGLAVCLLLLVPACGLTLLLDTLAVTNLGTFKSRLKTYWLRTVLVSVGAVTHFWPVFLFSLYFKVKVLCFEADFIYILCFYLGFFCLFFCFYLPCDVKHFANRLLDVNKCWLTEIRSCSSGPWENTSCTFIKIYIFSFSL